MRMIFGTDRLGGVMSWYTGRCAGRCAGRRAPAGQKAGQRLVVERGAFG